MRTLCFSFFAFVAVVLLVACDDRNQSGGSCGGGGTTPAGLAITTTTLPQCGYNADYLQTLTAANGTQPYTWSLVSGVLPGNMEITIAGELVGNPLIQYGTFTFRVRVTDAVAATAEKDLSLDVAAPPPPPTYYGEPVVGQFVFVIDASSQAATVNAGQSQSRLARSIAEVQTSLAGLNTPYDKFEITAYSGAGVVRCFGSLQYNTAGVAGLAQTFLSALAANGDAPTYSALRTAHLDYGQDLNIVQFYSSSTPGADAGAPGGTATYSNILADSPYWFANQNNAMLAVRDLIGSGTQQTFAQQLAATAGGTYSVVP